MSGLLVVLPLQLACQLISTGTPVHGNMTIVEDPSVPDYTATLPNGYTAYPDIGVAYKYYSHRLTWNSARKQCLAEGASLAIVDSFQKLAYIAKMKEKDLAAYTGIHRLFENTEWTSVKDGGLVAFVPWQAGVLPNLGVAGCAALALDGTGLSPWACTTVLPSVCEIPLPTQKHGVIIQSIEELDKI